MSKNWETQTDLVPAIAGQAPFAGKLKGRKRNIKKPGNGTFSMQTSVISKNKLEKEAANEELRAWELQNRGPDWWWGVSSGVEVVITVTNQLSILPELQDLTLDNVVAINYAMRQELKMHVTKEFYNGAPEKVCAFCLRKPTKLTSHYEARSRTRQNRQLLLRMAAMHGSW